MAERIETVVTMTGIYNYERPAYAYGTETAYIYNMTAEDGTVYVWKTTSFMTIEVPYTGKPGRHCFEDRKGNPVDHVAINKGDRIVIKATVKSEGEYKGQPQTEVTRVKVLERIFKAETYEERIERIKKEKEAKKAEQLATIKNGDIVWRMPYRQYKEHYSDCETVIDSYNKPARDRATIEVIIREGRLKASGVRGKHYSGYEFFFIDTDGKKSRVCYQAISEETALRHLQKDFPDAKNITPGKIYRY